MFTTDISGRGLDYPEVTHILQFTLPPSQENYVHRLGRTARLGTTGEGILIISDYEYEKVYPRLLSKVPKPKRMNCFPEDQSYCQMKLKLITQARDLPEDLWLSAFRTMVQTFLNFSKANKAVVVKEVSVLFTNSMGRLSQLQIEEKLAKKMGLIGVPGVIIQHKK